jgi:hypothetical protein
LVRRGRDNQFGTFLSKNFSTQTRATLIAGVATPKSIGFFATAATSEPSAAETPA